jgi:hypothetical protein
MPVERSEVIDVMKTGYVWHIQKIKAEIIKIFSERTLNLPRLFGIIENKSAAECEIRID